MSQCMWWSCRYIVCAVVACIYVYISHAIHECSFVKVFCSAISNNLATQFILFWKCKSRNKRRMMWKWKISQSLLITLVANGYCTARMGRREPHPSATMALQSEPKEPERTKQHACCLHEQCDFIPKQWRYWPLLAEMKAHQAPCSCSSTVKHHRLLGG